MAAVTNGWPVSAVQRQGIRHSSFRLKMAESFAATSSNIQNMAFHFVSFNKPEDEELFAIQTKHLSVRFEVFMPATSKNAVFLEVTPCGFCKNWCFGGTYRLLNQGGKTQETRNNVNSN
jgi:hypothetical protein